MGAWIWNYAEIFLVVLAICVLAAIFSVYAYKISKLKEAGSLKELAIKRDILKIDDKFIYELLNLYYRQALQQSNIQFWFSILAAVVGFAFIILAILLFNGSEWYDFVFKVFPGTVIEVVSALFINQAKETREKATAFFAKLNYQMQIDKSVEIANSIENEELRSEVKSKIALHIIDMDKG